MPKGIKGFQKGHKFGKRFKKGHKINLGKKNRLGKLHPHSEITKEKIRQSVLKNPIRYWLNRKDYPAKGENHYKWKGGISPYYRRKTAPRKKPNECEICKISASDFKKGLFLDHNHKTGKFRGWICPRCNSAIGLVKENIRTLKAIIKYLNNKQNYD